MYKGDASHYAYSRTTKEQKTIYVPYSNQWTTTGLYALPGQKITLTRKDSNQSVAEIKLNYHRSNTNRAYQQRIYRAPLELSQQRLPINNGQTISFTTPYGGPIYVYIKGDGGAQTINVLAEGISHHPTITNFNDTNQISEFVKAISESDLPHVDLRTDQVEMHLRKDKFLNAIGNEYKTVEELLLAIVNEHVNTLYTVAGLKIQGRTLSETLPEMVLSRCLVLFGEDCLDENIHNRPLIQHANYDQNAHCGTGCSGNPWDASWSINPRGWGDNHELGHNLQTNKLNVNYVSELNRNNWGKYENRAQENSNNIFPYIVKWKARHKNNIEEHSADFSHKGVFYSFMSDVLQIKNSVGERVVLNEDCKVIDPGPNRYTAAWKNNAYAFNNNHRFVFYTQMALKADSLKGLSSNVGNGFNIYTLLYLHSRIFDKYTSNRSSWDENRKRLGFEFFPYDGAEQYNGTTIRNIPGNDFMLVSLAYLTQFDWRSHFDILGLYYSDLAANQVEALSSNGPIPMGLFELESDVPPKDMSDGLTFRDLSVTDLTTRWKDVFSPLTCSF